MPFCISYTIEREGRDTLESLPFSRIAESVLGENYELSLVFCDNKKSQELNRQYREKDKPTNVLSFPLDEISGEIFIDIEQVEKEEELFDRDFQNLTLFLFIHGLYHLEGYEHGSRMEEAEARTRDVFGV